MALLRQHRSVFGFGRWRSKALARSQAHSALASACVLHQEGLMSRAVYIWANRSSSSLKLLRSSIAAMAATRQQALHLRFDVWIVCTLTWQPP